MELSVIIPIYKTEEYIRACVDSVLADPDRDVEVILVDDGSPDTCPRICDEYAASDPRVKVVHKENGGLSSARNAGIPCIAVTWGFRSEESLIAAGAQHVARKPEEILQIVRNL